MISIDCYGRAWPLQDIANILLFCNKVGRGENILRNVVGNKGGAGRGVLHNNVQ